jgi:hypothetical protein
MRQNEHTDTRSHLVCIIDLLHQITRRNIEDLQGARLGADNGVTVARTEGTGQTESARK